MKEINLVAGFDPENPLNDDLERAANAVGWKLNRITHVEPEKIRRGELGDVLSDNVLWRRELDGNTQEENDLVWEWLNKHGKTTINTHVVGGRIRPIDKYFQQELYAKDEILRDSAVPSFVVRNVSELAKLLEEKKIDFPFVLKPRYGSLGKDIIYIDNLRDMLVKVAGLSNLENMTVEPYIDSDYDWRVFVIDGKAIGVMRKEGNKENPLDFEAKSAGWQKWNEEEPEIRDEVIRLAEAAARVLNLEYAGVDIIRDKRARKYYVLETNLSAGWYNGFSEVTGADVAGALVEYFVKREK